MSSDKFLNKYRISSTRLQSWDYGWNASYFVTICTDKREFFFGEIKNQKMILSNVGIIADILWYELKNHFPTIELDAFVVMPNHIHGIVMINGNENRGYRTIVDHCIDKRAAIVDRNDNIDERAGIVDRNDNIDERAAIVETTHALSLQGRQPGQNRFQNPGKNTLSSIIGSYKSAVTKNANRLGFKFKWQSRFYDVIIRDLKSHENIRNYINNNPSNWNKDKFKQ